MRQGKNAANRASRLVSNELFLDPLVANNQHVYHVSSSPKIYLLHIYTQTTNEEAHSVPTILLSASEQITAVRMRLPSSRGRGPDGCIHGTYELLIQLVLQ